MTGKISFGNLGCCSRAHISSPANLVSSSKYRSERVTEQSASSNRTSSMSVSLPLGRIILSLMQIRPPCLSNNEHSFKKLTRPSRNRIRQSSYASSFTIRGIYNHPLNPNHVITTIIIDGSFKRLHCSRINGVNTLSRNVFPGFLDK